MNNNLKLPKEVADDLVRRLSLLREKLLSKNLDAFLVSSSPNRYFLTGWMGDSESGYLLVTKKEAFIITDSRYTEEVARKVPHFNLIEINPYEEFWSDFLQKLDLRKLGFESQDLSVFALQKFKKQTKGINWLSTTNFIEEIRSLKDETEIKLIKKSVGLADLAFSYILKTIKPAMTELEAALKMEHFMKEQGATKNAWENFIVGSGPNSSMVHYSAGERKIKKGDMVLLDWGCVFGGYYCDISRVIFLGNPSNKQAEIYNLVLESQKKAFEQIRIGNNTKEVDLAARNFLKNKTDFYFKHAIGHGVGLEVHELPRVNERSETEIEPGQVFTVEPGIYIPHWGGVRLEDMILITDKGYEVLTKATKEIKAVTVN